jgi:hypothetical protein
MPAVVNCSLIHKVSKPWPILCVQTVNIGTVDRGKIRP